MRESYLSSRCIIVGGSTASADTSTVENARRSNDKNFKAALNHHRVVRHLNLFPLFSHSKIEQVSRNLESHRSISIKRKSTPHCSARDIEELV